MYKKLENLIEKFLSKRKKSDGGWADVTDDELDEFMEIVELLALRKWEPDYQGSLPIKFEVINRHTHYWPMPVWGINHDENQDDLHKMSLMVRLITEHMQRMAQNKLSFRRDMNRYYDLLEKDQIIEKGDEFYDKDYDEWVPVVAFIGNKYTGDVPVRRLKTTIVVDYSHRQREGGILAY